MLIHVLWVFPNMKKTLHVAGSILAMRLIIIADALPLLTVADGWRQSFTAKIQADILRTGH